MNDKKIRVAIIYKKSYNFFQPGHFDRTSYDFFFKALKRNAQLFHQQELQLIKN